MHRRHWLAVVALFAAGCSKAANTGTKKKSKSGRDAFNRGPQQLPNAIGPWIDDLKTGSAEKKIAAALELANHGSDAKAALPELEKLASDKNPQVSAAAKKAVAAIKKKR